MAQGIEVPLKTRNGRLKLLGGDDYIDMIVRIAMGSSESENPFQEIGLYGDKYIFGINDGMTDGEIVTAVLEVFESLKLDQLAEVGRRDITFDRSETGALNMTVNYKNIETQERKEISVPVPPASE